MKWFKGLVDSKKAVADTFNGVADEWDTVEAELASDKAGKANWQIMVNNASDKFDAEMFGTGENW